MYTYWGLQNNWESNNGFQRFFSSKLVQISVENRWVSLNYFAIGSTSNFAPCTKAMTTAQDLYGRIMSLGGP